MSHHRYLAGDWELCGTPTALDQGHVPHEDPYTSEDSYTHLSYYDQSCSSPGEFYQPFDNSYSDGLSNDCYFGSSHSFAYPAECPPPQMSGADGMIVNGTAADLSKRYSSSATSQTESSTTLSRCSSEMSPPVPALSQRFDVDGASYSHLNDTLHPDIKHIGLIPQAEANVGEDTSPSPPPESSDEPRAKRNNPRFVGDMYTAKWVRGEGIERAGWCSICSTWHKLKDSAYWYHMHYSHGISCATGRPFRLPEESRPVAGMPGLEVLCRGCNNWVLVGRPDRWQTAYYRHAYKCEARYRSPGIERSRSGNKNRSPRKAAPKPVRTASKTRR